MSANVGIVEGRVGSEPKIYTNDDGKKIARFSIAQNERFTNGAGETKEKVNWIPVAVYNASTAEYVSKNIHAGDLVLAQGKIEVHSYDDEGKARNAFELAVRPYHGFLERLGTKAPKADPSPQTVGEAIGTHQQQAALSVHNQL